MSWKEIKKEIMKTHGFKNENELGYWATSCYIENC